MPLKTPIVSVLSVRCLRKETRTSARRPRPIWESSWEDLKRLNTLVLSVIPPPLPNQTATFFASLGEASGLDFGSLGAELDTALGALAYYREVHRKEAPQVGPRRGLSCKPYYRCPIPR